MKSINVRIVHPSDPVGVIPGGIDTCIRGIIRWAPEDISFSMLGMTTDKEKRKVGEWARCDLGKKTFDFLPLFYLNPSRQPKVPALMRLMFANFTVSDRTDFDLLQFHRIEPLVWSLGKKMPKVTFMHQNMADLKNKNSDIRWKYAPSIYFRLENILLPRFDAVYVVREDAANSYKNRYPAMSSKIRFVPTWMDPEVFFSINDREREELRFRLCSQHGVDLDNQKLIVFVGRLDRQKDPILMIEAFKKVSEEDSDAHLVIIGDGVLRQLTEEKISKLGIRDKVTFLGLLPNNDVADWLRISDLLLLCSAYEGMPRCVVEALGCGLPVASTDVGEVRRLVIPGRNGEVAEKRDAISIADAALKSLKNRREYRGAPCVTVAGDFTPQKILEPVYEDYRRLATRTPSQKRNFK